MPISLKNSTSLFPYLRYSPQKDKWFVPSDGTAKAINILDKPIAMDPENGTMGWLHIDVGTRDWQPFAVNDVPKAPGPNYKRGFSLLCYAAKALGSPEIFEMCSSTGAHNSFCEELYNECEPEFGKGKIPIVKVTGATERKVGKGTSADIHFEIVKWIERPPAFTEAVTRRNGGGKEEPAASTDSGEDDFGIHETPAESKPELKAKKVSKKKAKPESLSDILDDDVLID